jgi:DNA-binding NarL/FixJ family response regulator
VTTTEARHQFGFSWSMITNRFVVSSVRRWEKRSELQIVGEASDGLEAVHKAEELQPDLIVLDIGLPTLNGIEVVRRLRKLCPECKILVVSQESLPM